MRFKPVPDPPADLEVVTEAQRAVPLVPDDEADCCARLRDRLDLPARDDARTWLTFLRALGLAAATDAGFRRVRVEPTPDRLRRGFLDGVFGAAELHGALSGESLTARAAFERVGGDVPGWERRRHRDWEAVWRDQVVALLDWLVLLGLAERVPPRGGEGSNGGDTGAGDGRGAATADGTSAQTGEPADRRYRGLDWPGSDQTARGADAGTDRDTGANVAADGDSET